MQGSLPGTCRSRKDGSLRRAGPDGAIGLLFDISAGAAVIRPDGSFGFTAKNAGGEDLDPATLTITGTFFGNNVLGRLKGRSGKGPLYSSCEGNEPFWARRVTA